MEIRGKKGETDKWRKEKEKRQIVEEKGRKGETYMERRGRKAERTKWREKKRMKGQIDGKVKGIQIKCEIRKER